MNSVIQIDSLKKTILWKKLNEFDDQLGNLLAANLVEICKEASNRMKIMPIVAPQYTLHDKTHLLRVVEIMGLILGDTVEILNQIELSLLILSAFFHDQGMILDDNEYEAIKKTSEFNLFKENWYLDHPNKGEIQKQLNDSNISEKEREDLSLKMTLPQFVGH